VDVAEERDQAHAAAVEGDAADAGAAALAGFGYD
jgi:hypothetical protein